MKTALVLGATGGIGGEVTAALLARGWSVRALHRNPVTAAARWLRPGQEPEWVAGDAMVEADVKRAAGGAHLIVHAVNPPGYRDWDKLVLPMFANSLTAARLTGARLLLPGNVYNFGRDAFPLIRENAPQVAPSRKGAIRVVMEKRLRDAAAEGVRGLVVRAGDFFGPYGGNNWFSQALVTPGRAPTSVLLPGDPDVGHAWAYLPDVAETMVRLAERDAELPAFASFGMDGQWDHDGRQMAAAIERAVGHKLRRRRFPWLFARVASPFVPFFKEVGEMRYLWRESVRIDNSALVALLGSEPHTPLDQSVAATLRGLGCVDRP